MTGGAWGYEYAEYETHANVPLSSAAKSKARDAAAEGTKVQKYVNV